MWQLIRCAVLGVPIVLSITMVLSTINKSTDRELRGSLQLSSTITPVHNTM